MIQSVSIPERYSDIARSDPGLNTQSPKTEDCKIAYLMSRFPKLTETFVLFEMLAIEEAGANVEVFPLLGGFSSGKEVAGANLWRKLKDHLTAPAQLETMHAEAKPYVERARYSPFINVPILLCNMSTFLRNPIRYAKTISEVIRGNRGNSNFLLGGLAVFMKCVYFARQMQEEQITHIHAHFANHPALAAYVIHRFTGIPFSFTAHGSDLHRQKHMLAEKVRQAAFVVAISSYNRDAIVNHCGPQSSDKIKTIHCGVDLETFRPTAKVRRGNDILQIICVGTLHEVKGQSFLIRAVSQMRSNGIDTHLHFVGDGPDLAMLQRLAVQESLDTRVTFHGTKTRDELVELLQNADVLAAPSVPTSDGRREGIPVVLMEGMACGLPVVASRLSGIPELVNSDDVGLLVEPKDICGLAGAFELLAQDKGLRTQMGRNARQRIADEFALHNNAKKLINLFQLSRSNAHRA